MARIKAPTRNPKPRVFVQKLTTGTLADCLEVEFRYHSEGGQSLGGEPYFPGWTYYYTGLHRHTSGWGLQRFSTLLECLVAACVSCCEGFEHETWELLYGRSKSRPEVYEFTGIQHSLGHVQMAAHYYQTGRLSIEAYQRTVAAHAQRLEAHRIQAQEAVALGLTLEELQLNHDLQILDWAKVAT